MDNKTMDRMVVEVAVNAARVEGMEAMREACARECDERAEVDTLIAGATNFVTERHKAAAKAMASASRENAQAIRALKTEEVLK